MKYINSRVIIAIVDFRVDVIFLYQGIICFFACVLSGIEHNYRISIFIMRFQMTMTEFKFDVHERQRVTRREGF